jgi:hypothetical protein
MQNINLEDLEHVYGGTTPSTPPTPITNSGVTGGSSSASCGGSDALLTSLNSIGSSIKDLSHKNNGGFGSDSTMLMLGMAMAMRNNEGPSNTVVVNGGGGCCRGGGGFSFHARW